MKSENRNPKAERRPKSEVRNPKAEARLAHFCRTDAGVAVGPPGSICQPDAGQVWMSGLELRISAFGFPSAFGFRHSDLPS
jgi:hypothetical protein